MLKTENSLVSEGLLSLMTYLKLEQYCALTHQEIWTYLQSLALTPEQKSHIERLMAQQERADTDRFIETVELSTHTTGTLDEAIRESLQGHVEYTSNLKEIEFISSTLCEPYLTDQTVSSSVVRPEPIDSGITADVRSTQGPRYRALSTLGEGGTGVVKRVFDHVLQRDVALKLLKSTSDGLETSLVREALLTSSLEHPNIIPIYEWVSAEEVSGTHVISGGYTMRITEHKTLNDHFRVNEEMDLFELCSILKQVALALDYAHKRGVIHRDIKPHNILLGQEGEVYLTDWGIALRSQSTDQAGAHHRAHKDHRKIVGTPAYMSPEQLLGDLSKVGPHSDVYSLGVTLYQGLTRRRPFRGKTLTELFHNIFHSEVIPPSRYMSQRRALSSLDASVEAICLKALARDPRARFQSARELVAAFDQALRGIQNLANQRKTAQELIARGRDEQARHHELTQQQLALQSYIQQARVEYQRDSTDEQRSVLWGLEEQLDRILIPQEEALARAISAYQSAITLDDSGNAHIALAELLWAQFSLAESQHDQRRQTYFEEQIRSLKVDSVLRKLDRPGQLYLIHALDDVEIEIWSEIPTRYRIDRALVYQSDQLSQSPINLPSGVYRLTARHHKAYPSTYHFTLKRGELKKIDLRLPKLESIAQGFVYVPAEDGMSGLGVMTASVTCQAYFHFLNQLPHTVADRHTPRYQNHLYITRGDDGRFCLPFIDYEGDEWHPDWPVFLVNYQDAVAYARWWSEEIQRSLRLPTTAEWTWAAQGADDRPYPWGLSFDASLCHMRESTSERPLPAPVGSYPKDCSPFGLYDVAGNMAQWTSDPLAGAPEMMRVCGAAYNSMDFLCELSTHISAPRDGCFVHLGFRLVYELDPDQDYLV